MQVIDTEISAKMFVHRVGQQVGRDDEEQEGCAMTAPAGWYPNPEDDTQKRYWDGAAWTDHTTTDDAEPTVPLAPSLPPPPPTSTSPSTRWSSDGPQPWYMKKWVWITVGVFVLLGILGAVSGNNDTAPVADKPQPVATVTQAPQPTVTVTATPTPSPSQVSAPAPAKKAAPAAASWVMPNEVGTVLQTAQDDIQALTGNPFFYTSSEDARGDSRFQILDRDWTVCSQRPRPGTRFTENTDVTFFVVKLEETCP